MEEVPKFGGKHSSTMLWRFNPEWYRLIGSRCTECGMLHYPRRKVCVYPCKSRAMADIELSHSGEIRYAGLNSRGTDGYLDVQPQVFATIKLDGGPHVVGEIVNLPVPFVRDSIINKKMLEKLNGARVSMVVRRFRKHDNGDITYGHKFRLEGKVA